MKTEEEKKMLVVILSIINLALIAPLIIYEGFVVMTLWNWFVVLLGAPAIPSIAVGAGIMTITGFLTHQMHIHADDDTPDIVAKRLYFPWVGSTIVLIAGYIIHLCV